MVISYTTAGVGDASNRPKQICLKNTLGATQLLCTALALLGVIVCRVHLPAHSDCIGAVALNSHYVCVGCTLRSESTLSVRGGGDTG